MGVKVYRGGKFGGKDKEPTKYIVLARDASGKTTELLFDTRTKTEAYQKAKAAGFTKTKLKDVRPAEKYQASTALNTKNK